MFGVGMKVACVDASSTCSCGVTEFKLHAVYTVSWTDGPSVKLREIPQRIPCGVGNGIDLDMPFRASRFRPLVERKTSIEIFTKMLTPTGRRKPVNV